VAKNHGAKFQKREQHKNSREDVCEAIDLFEVSAQRFSFCEIHSKEVEETAKECSREWGIVGEE